jgi:WhiB family redox-sensing transcriptional regulator
MLAESYSWMKSRACKGIDPHMFYSDLRSEQAKAQLICRDCPVRAECLQYALEHREHGVWGGTTERERRRIRTGNCKK